METESGTSSTQMLDKNVENGDLNVTKEHEYITLAKKIISLCWPLVILIVLTVHFVWASVYFGQNSDDPLDETMCTGYGFLMLLYILIFFGYSYVYIIEPFLLKPMTTFIWKPIYELLARLFGIKFAEVGFYIIVFAAIISFIVYDSWDEFERLIPLGGLCFFFCIGFIFSKHRSRINWHTVIWGLILTFLLGMFTLRWDTGRNIFDCAGDKVTTFLDYSKNGSAFVYGDTLVYGDSSIPIEAIFAFSSITTIYFLSFIINILYHLGIMQKVVGNLGTLLEAIIGTSICESVNSAANIFLGQSEAPLLLKPYLANMTESEMHTVMTAGFASVSGTVLAAYISYGAEAGNLITASVMAAPAGLMFSKLMFPETEEIKVDKKAIALVKSEFSSLLDAASQGATLGNQVIFGIISNLIAFISTVYFVNGVLTWAGILVGVTDEDDYWTIELIVGYIFTPISFLMGVPWDECNDVGKLVGIKMIVNEFAAFKMFQDMKDSLQPRSQTIATFAICGFANPGSIGLVISAMGALVPDKRHYITNNVFRAYISGSIVCFMIACIAGMLTSTA